ncbi:MAG: hypothetical protein V1717_02130 [Candidatus Micrarchaeota archaeon]
MRENASLVKRTLDLEDLLAKEKSKPTSKEAEFERRLDEAYASLYNTLQDVKQLKAESDFTSLKKAKEEIYESVLKCKVVAEELKDFLDVLGDESSAGAKQAGGSHRRHYR